MVRQIGTAVDRSVGALLVLASKPLSRDCGCFSSVVEILHGDTLTETDDGVHDSLAFRRWVVVQPFGAFPNKP